MFVRQKGGAACREANHPPRHQGLSSLRMRRMMRLLRRTQQPFFVSTAVSPPVAVCTDSVRVAVRGLLQADCVVGPGGNPFRWLGRPPAGLVRGRQLELWLFPGAIWRRRAMGPGRRRFLGEFGAEPNILIQLRNDREKPLIAGLIHGWNGRIRRFRPRSRRLVGELIDPRSDSGCP